MITLSRCSKKMWRYFCRKSDVRVGCSSGILGSVRGRYCFGMVL